MSEQSTIGDYLYRAMLFLGIFAVASNGGDNSYTFEIGLNLLLVLLFAIFMMGAMKMIEMSKYSVEKSKKQN